MKIELYARTLTQEYPDDHYMDAPAASAKDRECWANWKFDWGDQKWRNGELLPKDAEDSESLFEPTPRINSLVTREEEFGGLIYDPCTTAVFRVDKDGLKAVRHMAGGYRRAGVVWGSVIKPDKQPIGEYNYAMAA